MENSFVVANGTSSASAGISVTNGALAVRYTTVADNSAMGVDTMQCLGGASGEVRNSILVDDVANSVDVAGCNQVTFEGNGADGDLGAGNKDVGAQNLSWFTGANDFHLAPGHPFGDVATWKTGDPAKDYDGDARPGTDGTPDVAGADEP